MLRPWSETGLLFVSFHFCLHHSGIVGRAPTQPHGRPVTVLCDCGACPNVVSLSHYAFCCGVFFFWRRPCVRMSVVVARAAVRCWATLFCGVRVSSCHVVCWQHVTACIIFLIWYRDLSP